MSVVSLQEDMANFHLAGFTLNVEERAALSASLLLKREQEKLASVSFWGKINGITKDYYIATSQVLEGADLFQTKFFYSLDLVNWLYLPTLTPAEMKVVDTIPNQFRGDPGFVYNLIKDGQEAEVKMLTEEQRLAGTIAQINYETHIVPRGAYIKNAAHTIVRNPNFSGLEPAELGQVHNYLHFRPGYAPQAEDIAKRLDTFDEALDIFQSVGEDKPAGVWSVQVAGGERVAMVKSLQWPGVVFFHARATPTAAAKFGGLYFGTGQKNQNIGYML